MKRLLIPLLVAPSLAMAGLLIVDEPAKIDKTKQAATFATTQANAQNVPVAVGLIALPKVTLGTPKWEVEEGQPFHLALAAWAKEANWTLYWTAKSWKAAGRVDMSDQRDVSAAVEEVIKGLHAEGKPIKVRISEGNRVMEVFSTEVKND